MCIIIAFTWLQVTEEEGENGGVQVLDVAMGVNSMLLARVSLNGERGRDGTH